MPDRETIARWVIDDIDGFAAKYAHARELQADELFDSAQDVAETHEDVNRAKLIVSTIQWRADKLAPKKYGPRIELEHNGSLELTADKALERLESSLSKALEQLGL